MARCFSGQRLRDARSAAGLKPEQLAVKIDRSVYSIHEYERGRVTPPVDVLVRICVALGRRLDDFLEEEAAGAA